MNNAKQNNKFNLLETLQACTDCDAILAVCMAAKTTHMLPLAIIEDTLEICADDFDVRGGNEFGRALFIVTELEDADPDCDYTQDW